MSLPPRLLHESRYALAGAAYERGVVRLASRDLGGCDHLAATRRGLFAVNPRESRLLAHGLFYGLTVIGDDVYAFEAGDLPRRPTVRGRIVRLRRAADEIVSAEVVATGLDNGCHQIDFVRDELCVLDTYNQAIVALDLDRGSRRELRPLPFSGDPGDPDYAHVNSLLRHGSSTRLLLHNGGRPDGRRSEVATLDADWRLTSRETLDGRGCHNLALLEDGALLTCASLTGELIGTDGLRVRLGDMMTRGLSVDASRILVGGSTFATRERRDAESGAIYFLDRDYRTEAVLPMPAPVTEIRKIDGYDRSLSPHLATLERGPAA